MATAYVRQITVRLPESLYRQMRQLAKKKGVSINKLAQQGFQTLTQEALEHEMRAAYDALATDMDEGEIETFLPAQHEVVTREPA